tara:strand:+ start:7063 stop:7557 length:495 start_codon:yes stop_codon:yes gene_type:complete
MSKERNREIESRETHEASREVENRETEIRDEPWKPQSILPDPDPKDGYVFRWIATSVNGTVLNTNVSSRFREGWSPVTMEEHPEIAKNVVPDYNSHFKGNIEIGGLLLCKADEKTMKKRDEYYQNMAKSQIEATDQNYFREQDPRMPMQSEKDTRVKFGSEKSR